MSKYSKAEVEYRVNAPKVVQTVVSFPNPLTLSTAIRFLRLTAQTGGL